MKSLYNTANQIIQKHFNNSKLWDKNAEVFQNEQTRSRREAGPQRRKTNEAVCSSNGHRWLSQHPVSLLGSLNRQLMVS